MEEVQVIWKLVRDNFQVTGSKASLNRERHVLVYCHSEDVRELVKELTKVIFMGS
jgi:hypothetical protein